MFLVCCWLAVPRNSAPKQCPTTAAVTAAMGDCSLTLFKTVTCQSFHLALRLFFSGKHSISAKTSIQYRFKVPTDQFAYLCMCQDHEHLLGPWLAHMEADLLRDQESQAALFLVLNSSYQVSVRCQLLSTCFLLAWCFRHSWLTSLACGFRYQKTLPWGTEGQALSRIVSVVIRDSR